MSKAKARITLFLLTLPLLAAAALACAPADAPLQPRTTATGPIHPQADFWDCVLDRQQRYQNANAFQRRFSFRSEMFRAQSAAGSCRQHLPDYSGPIEEPAIAGEKVKACLDAERQQYLESYPQGPNPDTNDFIQQALTRVCYIAERRPDYGFEQQEQ